MKKYIIGLAFMAIVMIAPVARAATVEDIQTLQTQYQSALITLIGLLQQQVEGLIRQLVVVQESQSTLQNQTATIATAVTQIQQNTTPIPTPIVAGGLPPSISLPPVDCSVTVPTNVGTPSTLISLSWKSSNATSVNVTNSHVGSNLISPFDVTQIASGTRDYILSSEAGELNQFIFHFVGNNSYKDCEVDVLTQ